MISTAPESARTEWATSWQVPVVAALAIAVSMIPMYSLGALMPSIHASTGWSRSQITSGLTITSFATVLLSPFVGTLVDRVGSRRIGLTAIVLYCIAMSSLALTGTKIRDWWLLWSLVAVTDAFIRVTVWTKAVVTRFNRGRGMAIGLVLSGTGLGSTCIPFLATIVQEHFGWRATFAILPLGGLLLTFPLLWLFFYGGNEVRSGNTALPANRSDVPELDKRQAAFSRRYLQMFFACLLTGIASGGLAVHFVPILRSGGLSAHTAAAVAGAAGMAVILGRLLSGYLLDRMSAPLLAALSCILPLTGCMALLMYHTVAAGLVASITIGLSTGSEIAALSYLIPRYFGLRHFGLLFGMISGLLSLGTGVGPLLAASIFDRSGSYHTLMLYCIPLYAMGAILLGTLGSPAARRFVPAPV